MPIASILVAAYNSARFIVPCLESLSGQTLNDIEVICVDDGSTDSTYKILSNHAIGDHRFRVLHQNNFGASSARNHALKFATGKYSVMVDSDDWLSKDAIALAVAEMEKNDYQGVLLDLHYYYQDTGLIIPKPIPVNTLNGIEAFQKSLNWQVHGLVCWQTEYLKRYGFSELAVDGDEYTTRLLFINSQNIGSCSGRYYYRQHSASITKKFSVKSFGTLLTQSKIQELIASHNLSGEISGEYLKTRFLTLSTLLKCLYENRNTFSRREYRFCKSDLKKAFSEINRHPDRPVLFYKGCFVRELTTRFFQFLEIALLLSVNRNLFKKKSSEAVDFDQ